MAVSGISFDVTSDPTGILAKLGVRLRSAAQPDGDKEKSSLDNIAAGLDEVVARIYVEDGKLKFMWTKSKYAQLAEQFRNCVLCLAMIAGNATYSIAALPENRSGCIRFRATFVTVPVNGDSLPSSDVLFLEVQPSPAFASKVSIEPSSGKVACNKMLTIKALDNKQQKIEVRVMLRNKGSDFVIVIGPRFQIGSEWQPFTTEHVNDGLRGLETALQRHRDGLANAKKRASSTASELSSVQSQLASTNDASVRYRLSVPCEGCKHI